ncbi:hypothetical protein [Sulfurimonas sp.]|uniref:hypothetical protein n=1 Tax=Sulfurimonas sp. TaxID=2022749 RepID=UPI002B4881D8|nr:hypothetical protein [Sulfurimonas sp.]
METRATCQSYLTSMQNYHEPFIDKFEEIYNQAQKAEINLKNEKQILPVLARIPKESEDKEQDSAVARFLDDLCTKGALKFLADLNMEKIQAKIDEYRNKLIAKMGDSPDAMKEIAKLISSFKKRLLEELEASLDRSKDAEPSLKVALFQVQLNMKKDTSKALEELLSSR